MSQGRLDFPDRIFTFPETSLRAGMFLALVSSRLLPAYRRQLLWPSRLLPGLGTGVLGSIKAWQRVFTSSNFSPISRATTYLWSSDSPGPQVTHRIHSANTICLFLPCKCQCAWALQVVERKDTAVLLIHQMFIQDVPSRLISHKSYSSSAAVGRNPPSG